MADCTQSSFVLQISSLFSLVTNPFLAQLHFIQIIKVCCSANGVFQKWFHYLCICFVCVVLVTTYGSDEEGDSEVGHVDQLVDPTDCKSGHFNSFSSLIF